VWVERGGQVIVSEWRMQLLAAVDATGSLTRAAEQVGVPYRTAWTKLKEIEERLGIRLLDTQSGGAAGGGAQLTGEARELVARFRRVLGDVPEQIEQRFDAELRAFLSQRGRSDGASDAAGAGGPGKGSPP
jgi:molybdate transport system regulatory protein